MTRCLLVFCDGKWEEVDWEHGEVAEKMGGRITFIGCIPGEGTYAISLLDDAQEVNSACSGREDLFDSTEVRGNVLFVSTDLYGCPCEVDTGKIVKSLFV